MTSLRWSYGKVEFRYEFCRPVPLPVILTNHNHSQHGSGDKNHTIPAMTIASRPTISSAPSSVCLCLWLQQNCHTHDGTLYLATAKWTAPSTPVFDQRMNGSDRSDQPDSIWRIRSRRQMLTINGRLRFRAAAHLDLSDSGCEHLIIRHICCGWWIQFSISRHESRRQWVLHRTTLLSVYCLTNTLNYIIIITILRISVSTSQHLNAGSQNFCNQ